MIGRLIELAIGVGLEATREKTLKETFVPAAVAIAQERGWVSFGRLSSQVGITRRDAQIVLYTAQNQGVLQQSVNGRFYPVAPALLELTAVRVEEPPPRPPEPPLSPPSPPSDLVPRAARGAGTRSLAVMMILAAVAIAAAEVIRYAKRASGTVPVTPVVGAGPGAAPASIPPTPPRPQPAADPFPAAAIPARHQDPVPTPHVKKRKHPAPG